MPSVGPPTAGRRRATDRRVPFGPVVLLRHGTSQANRTGRTAGWQDVGLDPGGEDEAHRAARALISAGVIVQSAHVSVLGRARRTGEIVTASLGLAPSGTRESWRLNERHAGAFEGLTRDEMVEGFGRDRVRSWRHSLDVRPPQLSKSDARHPVHDARYRDVALGSLPAGESSMDVLRRVLPYWDAAVMADVRAGSGVLVVTHEHVIRLLLWHWRGRGGTGVPRDPIPNGVPLLLQLSDQLRVLRADPLPVGSTT